MEPRWMAVVHRVVARGGTLSHTFLHCFGANVTAGPVKGFFTCVQLCKGSQSGAFSGFSKWGGTGGDHEDS